MTKRTDFGSGLAPPMNEEQERPKYPSWVEVLTRLGPKPLIHEPPACHVCWLGGHGMCWHSSCGELGRQIMAEDLEGVLYPDWCPLRKAPLLIKIPDASLEETE